MKRILALYRNAYGGLSKPAWMLALVMLINRSGTMVVPFLSIYLTDALHFSLDQAGIILSLFGLGSMTGAYLGGWLTDKIGHFRVQVMSLAFGGILFFILSWFESFESLAIGIYILSVVSESLRPANASSVAHYAKPENITRAFSLNRMAINLGFSIGPALGGLLAVLSYRLLFMADGITCLAAALFFYIYFKEKKGNEPQDKKPISSEIKSLSPYRDGLFLAFVMLCTSFAVVFFQLFMTLPLYYHDVYTLSESTIGALLALNGIVVFSLEMILVYMLGYRLPLWKVIFIGCLLNGLSFVMLNLFTGFHILMLAMFVLSISEIMAMPFMATVVVSRSTAQNRGSYMGLYALAFSTAHVLAPFLGTKIIAHYDFSTLWWGAGFLSIISALGMMVVVRKMEFRVSFA